MEETPEPAPPAGVAPLTSWQFNGMCPPLGWLLLVGGACAAAVIVGVAYHAASRAVDMPFVSPILAGLFTGLAIPIAVLLGRCRNRPAILLVAFLAGIVMYGVRVVADSQEVRPAMVRRLSRVLIGSGLAQAQAEQQAEQRLTPWRTLVTFLRVTSHNGVIITDSNSSSYSISTDSGRTQVDGTRFTGATYSLLLIGETLFAGLASLLVAGIAVLITAGHTSVVLPYCEQDKRWMRRRPLQKLAASQVGEIAAAVRREDWNGLTAIPPRGTVTEQNYARPTVFHCPTCGSGTLAVYVCAKRQKTKPLHVILTPAMVAQLLKNIPPAKNR